MLSGHAAVVFVDLEDRISVFDGILAQRVEGSHERDAELVRLWQQRCDLMRELVKARVTRARYVGL